MTGHKRALGWGTFFAVLVTGGLWLLAIPAYPKRCIVCGIEPPEPADAPPLVEPFNARSAAKTIAIFAALAAAIVVVSFLVARK